MRASKMSTRLYFSDICKKHPGWLDWVFFSLRLRDITPRRLRGHHTKQAAKRRLFFPAPLFFPSMSRAIRGEGRVLFCAFLFATRYWTTPPWGILVMIIFKRNILFLSNVWTPGTTWLHITLAWGQRLFLHWATPPQGIWSGHRVRSICIACVWVSICLCGMTVCACCGCVCTRVWQSPPTKRGIFLSKYVN